MDLTETYPKEYIPVIRMICPQVSYLIFLDYHVLRPGQEELNRFLVEDAYLALNGGTIFGREGEGFMWLNAACSRVTLEKALK